jgi:hypothetical protein
MEREEEEAQAVWEGLVATGEGGDGWVGEGYREAGHRVRGVPRGPSDRR